MRTPTPEYDKFCHTDIKNNNDATANDHTQSSVHYCYFRREIQVL